MAATDKSEALRLSRAQREIWLAHHIDPANPKYNIGEYIEIRGCIDEQCFEAALRQVVTEAEVLNFRFVEHQGEPRQISDAAYNWSMPTFDLSTKHDPWLAAEAWMKADLMRPINLTNCPLFAFALFKTASDQYLWYLRFHHIVMDGFGRAIFAKRVAEAYTGLITRSPQGKEKEKFLSYCSYLQDEDAYLKSEQFIDDRKYWLERFVDRPDPTSFSKSFAAASTHFLQQTIHVSPSTLEKLRAIAQSAGATWKQVIVASVAAYSCRIIGSDDIVLTLPVLGRVGPSSRSIPGMMSNALPLRFIRLEEYLKRLDEGDVEEAGTEGSRVKNLAEKIEALRKKRGRYGALLAELEKSGESQISLTDPDSRAMAAHTKVGVGYNIQIAVDAKNKMIVEQEVTNQVVDMGLLTETAEPARAILDVEHIDVVADRGYFKIEDIEACEKAGMTPYVPQPQRGSSVKNGLFRKDEFRYDAARDVYVCPAGEALSRNHESTLRDLKRFHYTNPAACSACPLRVRCTTTADRRQVTRLENEAVLDRVAARLKARPWVLDRRREVVEHPFGSIKQWMYQGAFLTKGLEKVRAEFSLTALAYNLRRAINIVGVEGLMAAVRA